MGSNLEDPRRHLAKNDVTFLKRALERQEGFRPGPDTARLWLGRPRKKRAAGCRGKGRATGYGQAGGEPARLWGAGEAGIAQSPLLKGRQLNWVEMEIRRSQSKRRAFPPTPL